MRVSFIVFSVSSGRPEADPERIVTRRTVRDVSIAVEWAELRSAGSVRRDQLIVVRVSDEASEIVL